MGLFVSDTPITVPAATAAMTTSPDKRSAFFVLIGLHIQYGRRSYIKGQKMFGKNRMIHHFTSILVFKSFPLHFFYVDFILKKEFHRSIANKVSDDRWSEKQQ
jgi:hypothetical protein